MGVLRALRKPFVERLRQVILPGADKYRRTAFPKIPGWMHDLDLDVFDRILGHQLTASISGDILEVGSYHGKSAIICGYGLRDTETLTVCDIFGDTTNVPLEGTDPYDGLTVNDFLTQYRRFHKHDPDVRAMPSSELVLDRDYRFIHIDGGHAYEVVRDDITLAARYSMTGTVIALDDYRSAHTPGVAAAAWEAAGNGKLYPFLLSEVKLYAATSKADQLWWLDTVREFDLPHEEHEIFGLDVVRVWR